LAGAAVVIDLIPYLAEFLGLHHCITAKPDCLEGFTPGTKRYYLFGFKWIIPDPYSKNPFFFYQH